MPGWISLLYLGLRWAQAVPNVASSLWRPFSVLSWGSILVSSSPRLLGLRSRFFSPLLFSFCAEEFSRLDRRASSPLMYFSTLASTSVMLTYGFFEIENIRSFDCTPSPAMKAVMANFSSRMSTFNDSALNLWT